MYIQLLPMKKDFHYRGPVNKILLTVAVMTFSTITIHFVVQLLRAHKGYTSRIQTPNAVVPYLEDLTQPLAIVTGICFTLAAILTDGLTIYRLFMIWNRNIWVCIPPTLTLIGMLVASFVMCAVTQKAGAEMKLFGTDAGYWLIATFTVGLCTNFLALGFIGFRFFSSRWSQKASRSGLRTVITVVIESTALYSGTKFINLMLLLSESNVSYVFFCIVIPMIGIASHLLIIHAGYEKYFKQHTSSGRSTNGETPSVQLSLRSPLSSPTTPTFPASPSSPTFSMFKGKDKFGRVKELDESRSDLDVQIGKHRSYLNLGKGSSFMTYGSG